MLLHKTLFYYFHSSSHRRFKMSLPYYMYVACFILSQFLLLLISFCRSFFFSLYRPLCFSLFFKSPFLFLSVLYNRISKHIRLQTHTRPFFVCILSRNTMDISLDFALSFLFLQLSIHHFTPPISYPPPPLSLSLSLSASVSLSLSLLLSSFLSLSLSFCPHLSNMTLPNVNLGLSNSFFLFFFISFHLYTYLSTYRSILFAI